MKKLTGRLIPACSLILGYLFVSNPVRGQISPDDTLPTNVNQSGNVFEIRGGTQAGTNLFHSFREFSLPTGFEAFFHNGLAIENIISRVTGGFPSHIDGLIRANGGANLIVINPSGINFGLNARLDIGGSFLGSTANSIVFEDGTVFSATPTQVPLLTISVPRGLQWGANVAPIEVIGAHLAVEPGQTLALIGGDINLKGGTLTASQGQIDLGAVAGNSMVTIAPTKAGWIFGYEGVHNFRNIELSQQAEVSTTGTGGGDIQVTGDQIKLTELAHILAETLGSQKAGNIDVQARQLKVENGSSISTATLGNGDAGNILVNAELVKVSNSTLDREGKIVFSTMGARSRGTGNSGEIMINTGELIIEGGADISVSSLALNSPGIPGNITVNATESIQLRGANFNPRDPEEFSRSGLFASNNGIGDGSNSSITVNTPHLTISNGARISTSTRSTEESGLEGGSGANLLINTSYLELSGLFTTPDGRTFRSGLFAQSGEEVSGLFIGEGNQDITIETTDATGPSGNLTINAGEIVVKNGAEISATTFGNGDAGNIFVEAELVRVSGSTLDGQGDIVFSTIESRSRGTGNSGEIMINTGELTIEGGADISVSSLALNSPGIPGNITINATKSVQLRGANFNSNNLLQFSRSGLFASNNGIGDGSNSSITVNTPYLRISDGARISASARGTGEGGLKGGSGANVLINTSFLELSGLFTTPDGRTFRSGLFAVSGEEVSGLFIGQGNETTTIETSNASGRSGNLTIKAGEVMVLDGAQISVSASGTGSAGNINITTDSLLLNNGFITGTTVLGTGGNLNLNIAEQINLINNSQVSTRAGIEGGGGNGGNLTISSPLIITFPGETNQITANAFEGNGGNISITTESILGDEFLDISDSSQLGVDGVVEINNPNIDPTSGLVDVSVKPQDTTNQVVTGCAADGGNKFVVRGKGGLPTNPTQPLTNEVVWEDLRESKSEYHHTENSEKRKIVTILPPSEKPIERIIPIRGWIIGEDGTVILTAQPVADYFPSSPLSYPECEANQRTFRNN